MPFTPFHMGPGVFIKAVMQGSFSLMVFGWTQIVMDIQPLIVMISGEGHLHGFTHTYIGAVLIACFAALTGKYLSQIGLRILRITPSISTAIPWVVVVVSAFIGSFSHVLLDSLMHTDIQPLYPFDMTNSLLGLISIGQLHELCLYSGLAGAVIYYVVVWWRSLGKDFWWRN